MNIMAQIFGIFAVIIMFCSYQKKSKKDFLFLQMFMNIFYALQYFLLNAYSALASNIISMIRARVFYKLDRNNKDIHIGFFILFEIAIITLGILTYNGIHSIIPIVIASLYTYGAWQKKLTNTYKLGSIASLLLIYYNFIIGAYVSAIGSVIELIASIIGLIRLKNNTTKTQKIVDKA